MAHEKLPPLYIGEKTGVKRNLLFQLYLFLCKDIFGGVIMGRELLVREVKAAALLRMEDAARTEKDFNAVVKQWDHNDENEERRQRYHEVQRDEWLLDLGYTYGMVIPVPIPHPTWLEAIKGDFISMIYDSADDMWQIIEDWDVAVLVKNLTDKKKDVLHLRVVGQYTAVQLAYYYNVSDRAVRKLYASAIDSIRDKLVPVIREQIASGYPKMTNGKRHCLRWYDVEKAVKAEKAAKKKALAEKKTLEKKETLAKEKATAEEKTATAS